MSAQGEKKEVTLWMVTLVLGMLIFGSVNTVSKKMGYKTCSTGLSSVGWDDCTADTHETCSAYSDDPHTGQRRFEKPWTQTAVMFSGEAMCLLYYFFNRTRKPRSDRDEALLDE